MKVYSGKAKDYSFKLLLWVAFWELARTMETLELEDFPAN